MIIRAIPILITSALLQGCFGGVAPEEPDPITEYNQEFSNPGLHEICSYTNGLNNDGYSSARVSYPCDLEDDRYPSTTLTGGFINTKENMYWLADHLTTHGIVVIAMTPTNRLGQPPIWKNAHIAGFQQLAAENINTSSPIYNKLDISKRNIMGFSMGGGGTLLASAELGSEHTSTIALAPWLGSHEPDYTAMNTPTLILGSENDSTAPNHKLFYDNLPINITRGIAEFSDSTHGDWYGTSNPDKKAQFKALVTAWLKLYTDNDISAESYFTGEEHDQHLAEDWFTYFDYQP